MHKTSPISCVLVLFALLAAPEALAAATYYVDNSGSPACGNSPGNGSQTVPWCTVQYGVSRLSGGDTLFVKNGTYNEAFTITGPSGTANAHTIISAYPGHSPVLRGAGYGGGRMKITRASYLDFRGFEITNYNQGLYIDDDAGTDVPPHHITASYITVHDVGQEGVAIKGDVHDILVEYAVIYNTGHNSPTNNGEGFYVGGAANPDNSYNITIRNSVIHDVPDEGIELKPGTHDCVVENNVLYNIMGGNAPFSNTAGAIEIDETRGFYGSNPNHLIRNNVVRDVVFTSGITKRGIRIGTGSTVYNNVVYNVDSRYSCLHSDSPDYLRIIYHNTIDCVAAKAVVNSGTTIDVRNNIGPSTAGNLATSDSFYVNKAAGNYHLAAGAAPINAGQNLTSVVATDFEGRARSTSPPPDLGAYEYGGSAPGPPTNLRIQ